MTRFSVHDAVRVGALAHVAMASIQIMAALQPGDDSWRRAPISADMSVLRDPPSADPMTLFGASLAARRRPELVRTLAETSRLFADVLGVAAGAES